MKVLLAGFGQMGKYYTEKLRQNADAWGVRLVGIADIDPNAFDLSRADDKRHDIGLLKRTLAVVPCYPDVETAMLSLEPDIIINATNNEGHIKVIRELERHSSIKVYLTEKPLVGEAENMEEAAARLARYFVSMNMVTNFSEAVQSLQDWHKSEPGLKLIGIEGTWGKDRRRDRRPTPGISSDIVHPVGLIQSIFGPQSWNISDKAQGLYGLLSTDRSGQPVHCVFHYNAEFRTDIAPVRLDCSYAWHEQHRRITAFFEQGGHFLAAELFLDEAEPDSKNRSDFLRVSKVPKDAGEVEILFETERSAADKLETYLQKSIAAFQEGMSPTKAGLVGLREEHVIGEIYGLFQPSLRLDELKASPYLAIREASPDDESTPKNPEFPVIAECTRDQLVCRINRFTAAGHTPAPAIQDKPTPQPS